VLTGNQILNLGFKPCFKGFDPLMRMQPRDAIDLFKKSAVIFFYSMTKN
jgi:hypothetical protein